ncbi:aspartate:alanine exchanger family transporter [Vibrio ouci]|uniref:Transporter n=1 Tax=Vibrio ouci TaxID=2499078 RepID=A0A4Y8WD49_9VIBR|nr:transporter [Vibrio ouci]TFH90288.1 transporter [Vibrio ouci]
MEIFFIYLSDNPFVFLFLSLALGYPLGTLSVRGVSLGTTAGTLLVGVSLALTAFSMYGRTIPAPGLVSDIFLMMFMYSIGMKVGPQFFSGLVRGGVDFVVIGLIVVTSNVLIVWAGVQWFDLEPGYAAGIISGSYTVTAVMGVAQSAIDSGAYVPPAGISAEHISANIAAGYAISYLLSSVLIIVFIKSLPTLFGRDPVAAAAQAEAEFSPGASQEKLPGTFGFSQAGVLPIDVRAYRVSHQALVGKTVQDLYQQYPNVAILTVVRDQHVLEASENPSLALNDVIGVLGEYHVLLSAEASDVAHEVDEPRARNVDIEVADIPVGRSEHAGKTVSDLHAEIGFGVYFKALFRQGHAQPVLAQTRIEVGDVLRVAGPTWCVAQTAASLHSVAITESTLTETFYLAVSLLLGYVIGHASVTFTGIPFALGTSAGCMLVGIGVSFLRTRNPAFGGPMSEGARSFLQDIGLNLFVAVLAASVGPKILDSFQGTVVVKVAIIGIAAALVPPLLAWLYGLYVRKMNPAILAGACAGGRNSTPAMKGAQEVSHSDIPAIGYPVPYALTSVLVLIFGYITMVLS